LDYHTFKYETGDGDRIWKKTYSGPGIGPDVANAIAVDNNGNVYATGSSFGIGSLADIATVKYDRNGNSQWGKRYNGPGNSTDQANAITVDNKGFVYVTGFSSNPGTSIVTNANADYTTIKYKDNGDVVWIKRYNGPGNFIDVANAIAVDPNGNVYVTGQSSANGASTDYTTIKYDANGNELWVARYNGPGNFTDNALALVVDASGNVYITGSSYGAGTASIDAATIKYNAAGMQQWVQRFTGGVGKDIGLDAAGNVYITGFSSGGTFTTIKYNNAGVQQWVAIPPGNGGLGATALALDPSGNVYVTGGSSSSFGIPGDYLTIKYNTAGVQQWEIRYNGPGNGEDVANDIRLDKDCNVYVTGSSVGNRTLTDYATIKYVQAPLITAREGTIPEQSTAVIEQGMAKLTVRAYPNAFTQYINLQWSGSDKPVAITITNAMGQLVEKRTGLAPSGSIRTGSNFGKGIYYAEIVQGTEKMLLKLIKN
jgi:hypothetical protein